MNVRVLYRKFLTTIIPALGIVTFLASCSADSNSFYVGSLGLNEGYILISTNNGTTDYTITKYDISGQFVQLVLDTTATGLIPRGMALFDPLNILVIMDGVDSVYRVNHMTGKTAGFYQGALLAGNLYQVARRGNSTFIVESNNIERINGTNRYPASGNAYIPTTVGACTIGTARGLSFNRAGNLLVTNTANNRILLYDVSSTTAACLASDASFGANQPIPVLGHTNGNVYFGTQVNDAIYVAPDDLSASPTILISGGDLNNPLAMAELPDGTILVANDGTDSIIRIDPQTGATLNGSFIKNGFTQLVTEILVVPPQ